jgi:hypothetical protein
MSSDSTNRNRQTAGGVPYWVRQQRYDISVLQQPEAPDRKPKEGEFTIKVWGPFPERKGADTIAERLRSQLPV